MAEQQRRRPPRPAAPRTGGAWRRADGGTDAHGPHPRTGLPNLMMWRQPPPATLGPMRSRPRDEHPVPGAVSESAGDIEETPDLQGAYPRLNDAQLTTLAEAGRRRAVQPEEILFYEGERGCDFFVILAGKVAVVEGRG